MAASASIDLRESGLLVMEVLLVVATLEGAAGFVGVPQQAISLALPSLAPPWSVNEPGWWHMA
jgi:hypothetical protein